MFASTSTPWDGPPLFAYFLFTPQHPANSVVPAFRYWVLREAAATANLEMDRAGVKPANGMVKPMRSLDTRK
jgi:hypothetical protein